MKLKIGSITNMIVHYVGNKYKEEGVGFSQKETQFKIIEHELKSSISNAFELNDIYEFYFEPSLEMNHIYTFIKTIFHNRSRFIEQSNFLAKVLYEQSCIPQIKGGEFCVIYMENCVFNGEKIDAIALLKIEKKQSVVQYVRETDGFRIEKSEAVNIAKIDKGCVIFNIDEDNGYKVVVVDNNATKQTAIYWKDNFLHIRSCNSAYHQTTNFIEIIKDFVKENILDDKATKATTIARTKKILTESDSISIESFSKDTFLDEQIAREFIYYASERLEKDQDESIIIDKKLVSPKAALPTFILHLDRNFDIKIYGGEDLIIKGYDEEIGLNYYKLYYMKEK